MRIRHVLVVATVALVVGAVAFAQNKQKQQQDTRSLQGKKAPAFEMQTLDGQDVKLADLKGNVVLLDFWATWCGPCREALPHVQSLANNSELTEKGLKVFAVNLREGEDKIKPFMEQGNYTFAVPLDREGQVANSYKVQGIPTQVLIGRDGMVKKVFVGYGGEAQAQELDKAIELALRAKPPAGSARGPATNPAESAAR
jgi:thiol-disulfide isomerase/thioredoxin